MNIAVIFAGGVGRRMKLDGLPKQFLPIADKPILAHTLQVFQDHDEIDAIVLVMVDDWIEHTRSLVGEFNLTKVKEIVAGGETGQLSIYNGLCAAAELAHTEGVSTEECIVLIHDGVRPVIGAELISRNIAGVRQHGSAITCVPSNETVVMVDDAGERVIRTVERQKTRIAKAPQSFWLADILAAHERALSHGNKTVIDSCTMMQLYGAIAPAVIIGDYDNMKVTTPEDYYMLKALLDVRAGSVEDV